MKRLFITLSSLFILCINIYANPSKSDALRVFSTDHMEVFNGYAKFNGGRIADGDYFAYVIWHASVVWGQEMSNTSAIIRLQDMEVDLPDDTIYLGDADNNPLTPYLNKLEYQYDAGCYTFTALVKVTIKNSAIIRIYTDNDAWMEQARKYGKWILTRY